ncbi:phosphatase PAP2 family protein [Halobacillus salinus]|uniref:Phosphatase PAP2 family protein n=1 Tax=Halobacillus salinus TaxID=192814 RepID=A0A4Z0H0N7_9BACI|nr:phosphatase PAP2 family protein [Halobacillus salinus]TGB03983.1 phosphatase PAP2 family protein [Halobacillus salinus]
MFFTGTKLSDLSKASVITILGGFISIGLAFYFFVELAGEVLEEEKFAVDKWATDVVMAIRTGGLGTFFGWVTELGSVRWIVIASIILAIYLLLSSLFSRWVLVYFAVNMLGISALTKVLKVSFERSRPEVLAEYDGTGFSFPSGHSTGAITYYGFLIYLVVSSSLSKQWKWGLNLFLGLVILLIGISRVYLGVHYLTDIAAGFTFGLAWLLVCISALEVTLWNQRRRQKGGK